MPLSFFHPRVCFSGVANQLDLGSIPPPAFPLAGHPGESRLNVPLCGTAWLFLQVDMAS